MSFFSKIATNCSSVTKAVQDALQLYKSLFVPWTAGETGTAKERITSVHTVYAYASTKTYGVLFRAHVEDCFLYSINYLSCGALKLRVTVPPSTYDSLQVFLEQYQPTVIGCKQGWHVRCSQFLRHMHICVRLEVLKHWDIP